MNTQLYDQQTLDEGEEADNNNVAFNGSMIATPRDTATPREEGESLSLTQSGTDINALSTGPNDVFNQIQNPFEDEPEGIVRNDTFLRETSTEFAGGFDHPLEESPDLLEDTLEHKSIVPEDSKRNLLPLEMNRGSKGGHPLPDAPTLDEEEEEGTPRDGESDDVDSEDETNFVPTEGFYDPEEFQQLPVSSEIKDLFQYISQYRPQSVEIDNTLKPFILDYIPAVGDIDAFIKIPRPDEVDDNLGLVVLDEPCARQSDPTVLDLHLRATTKEGGGVPKETVVKQLGRADRNPKEIEQWIANISELHKSKPATTVHYSKPMPDIDTLMQEWPPELEELLKRVELPTADMDVPLESYIDMICGILDIPVHKSRVQSLHVLFTLYSEFKNSQHFKALAEENNLDNETKQESATGFNTDTLVL